MTTAEIDESGVVYSEGLKIESVTGSISGPQIATPVSMIFSKPQYPLGRVDAAGRALVESWGGSPIQNVDDESLEIIKNWRAAHHFPLQIIKMMLKGRAKRIDPKALVSQRMKRLPSMRNKLVRGQSETMRLSQMQDIGGCRAVLTNMVAVDNLVELFSEGVAKNPTGRHKIVSSRDYITQPKEDGYRGMHYVLRYQSDSPHRIAWNGLRIEIQIRSKLQHAWATAVETVDTFTGQSLKFALGSNLGDPKWRRFFALMGTAIAIRERRPLVRGTPIDKSELVAELRDLALNLNAENVLTSLGRAVNVIGLSHSPKDAEYLLALNSRDKSITISTYPKTHLALLEAEYLRLEKEGDPDIQVVQVSVEDVAALRTAYPNYYLDTQAFVAALTSAIAPRSRKR